MIFSQLNEQGIPLWWLVFKGTKTCTRRKKPINCWKVQAQIYFPPSFPKTLAVQPKRTKAAICSQCGCWKEHHYPQIGRHYVVDPNYQFLAKAELPFDGIPEVCDHYTPLRVRVKDCALEKEWMDERFDREGDYITWEEFEKREAGLEGYATWDGLQAVLKKTNPENLPLYRIEFERC